MAEMASLRARLLARERPRAEFRLRITDPATADRALREASTAWRLAVYRDGDDSDAARDAKAKADEAQAEVDACYETLQLTALPPADMEALITAHPPTAEQREAGQTPWNTETFRPALLAACVEGDMTEADWADFITKGPVSLGEVAALWAAALGVNDRTPDASVPKG
jgi:hypothetical protein